MERLFSSIKPIVIVAIVIVLLFSPCTKVEAKIVGTVTVPTIYEKTSISVNGLSSFSKYWLIKIYEKYFKSSEATGDSFKKLNEFAKEAVRAVTPHQHTGVKISVDAPTTIKKGRICILTGS